MLAAPIRQKKKAVIPGFGLSIGITLSMLSFIVIIPLMTLFLRLSSIGFGDFIRAVTDLQVLSAYKVSVLCSLAGALVNCLFGLVLAWVLVRYDFPGKSLLDGLIELPFALPTAVAGITLTTLYADTGWIGSFLARLGIKVAYTTIGITIAMVFIGIPFVVRSIQPVLEKLDPQYEDAAMILGASRHVTFMRVIFPELLPALLTGFGLAFARGIGEYGSIIFIAGNIPYKTQIAPLIIMSKLEQFNYTDATAIALVMTGFSFLLLFLLHIVQARFSRATQ